MESLHARQADQGAKLERLLQQVAQFALDGVDSALPAEGAAAAAAEAATNQLLNDAAAAEASAAASQAARNAAGLARRLALHQSVMSLPGMAGSPTAATTELSLQMAMAGIDSNTGVPF